ncbi:YbjN domain-containing protein [Sutterella sp.]|uniref:YbjN domain-containing protein n=1 Tax=Sutterella sp. TaxID=1981025 RepID=UPI003FD8D54B
MNQAGLIERVTRFFNAIELEYEFDSDAKVFFAGSKLDCRLERCRIVIDPEDDLIKCYAFLPNVDEAHRPAVAEFITRANYGLKRGNFEFDFSDGEVRYRMYVDCPEDAGEPSDEQLGHMLVIPVGMLEQYGNAYLDVAEGRKSPAEAILDAER